MKRILLASILAALAMTAWEKIFWWTSLPYDAVKPVYEDTEIIRFLKMHFPDSGTYMIPGPHHDPDAVTELQENGPVATLLIRSKKNIPSKETVLVRGLAQTLITAFLLSCLMSYTCTAKSYWPRVGIIALAGVAAAVYNDLVDSIWWYQPWHWNLVKAAYDLIAWIVSGLLIALIIKPK